MKQTIIGCLFFEFNYIGSGYVNAKSGTKRKFKENGVSKTSSLLLSNENGNSSDGNGADLLENPESPSMLESDSDAKKRKKARTTFTGKQIYELERQFEVKKYLSSSERSDMARILNVTETQVRVKFTFLLYKLCSASLI